MQKTSLPKISVVIPVLNSGKTIEKAIRSVIDQQYENTEIIILDAGSTDGTVDIIRRYEEHIHYWHSRPDGSSGLAINLGIQESTGDLIAQLMADDWFEPNTFHAIAKAFIAHPDADVISCGGRIVCYDAKRQQYQTMAEYIAPRELDLTLRNMCYAIPAMSSRFLTKSLLDKVGLLIPFDANGKHLFSADRELLLRIAVHGCKNIVINHLGHTYFAHAASATFGNKRANQIKIFTEHMAIVDSYFEKYDLPAKQQAVLLGWHRGQSVRLFLHKVFEKDFAAAWGVAKKELKKSKLRWPIALFTTPCKIAARKGYLQFMDKIKSKRYV